MMLSQLGFGRSSKPAVARGVRQRQHATSARQHAGQSHLPFHSLPLHSSQGRQGNRTRDYFLRRAGADWFRRFAVWRERVRGVSWRQVVLLGSAVGLLLSLLLWVAVTTVFSDAWGCGSLPFVSGRHCWWMPPRDVRSHFVYVYELPRSFHGDLLDRLTSHHTAQFHADRLLFRFLQRTNTYRTTNPENASLFFIPVLPTLFLSLNHPELAHSTAPWVANNTQALAHAMKDTGEYVEKALVHVQTKHPFWRRSNGRDHFILASQEYGRCMLLPFVRAKVLGELFTLQPCGYADLKLENLLPTVPLPPPQLQLQKQQQQIQLQQPPSTTSQQATPTVVGSNTISSSSSSSGGLSNSSGSASASGGVLEAFGAARMAMSCFRPGLDVVMPPLLPRAMPLVYPEEEASSSSSSSSSSSGSGSSSSGSGTSSTLALGTGSNSGGSSSSITNSSASLATAHRVGSNRTVVLLALLGPADDADSAAAAVAAGQQQMQQQSAGGSAGGGGGVEQASSAVQTYERASVRTGFMEVIRLSTPKGWRVMRAPLESTATSDAMQRAQLCACLPDASHWREMVCVVRAVRLGCVPVTFFHDHLHPWLGTYRFRDFTVNIDPIDVYETATRLEVLQLDVALLWRLQSELAAVQRRFLFEPPSGQQQQRREERQRHVAGLWLDKVGARGDAYEQVMLALANRASYMVYGTSLGYSPDFG